jgi:hypothetical protein
MYVFDVLLFFLVSEFSFRCNVLSFIYYAYVMRYIRLMLA